MSFAPSLRPTSGGLASYARKHTLWYVLTYCYCPLLQLPSFTSFPNNSKLFSWSLSRQGFLTLFCFWDPHFFPFCQFLLCVRLGIPSARSPLCSVLSHLRVARYTLDGISYRPCVHSYTKALGPLHCCDFLCAHIARQSVFHHNNASLCCPHHPHWTVGTRLAQGGDLNNVHQIEEKVDRSIVGNGIYRTTGARGAKISLEYGQRDDQANQKDPEKRKK